MIQLYALIALVVAAVFTGGGFYIKSLRAEKATLTQAYSIAAQTAIDNKQALDTERAEHARVDGLLLDRARQLKKLEASNDLLNTALDDLKRADPLVRAWNDGLVPDGVRRLLATFDLMLRG